MHDLLEECVTHIYEEIEYSLRNPETDESIAYMEEYRRFFPSLSGLFDAAAATNDPSIFQGYLDQIERALRPLIEPLLYKRIRDEVKRYPYKTIDDMQWLSIRTDYPKYASDLAARDEPDLYGIKFREAAHNLKTVTDPRNIGKNIRNLLPLTTLTYEKGSVEQEELRDYLASLVRATLSMQSPISPYYEMDKKKRRIVEDVASANVSIIQAVDGWIAWSENTENEVLLPIHDLGGDIAGRQIIEQFKTKLMELRDRVRQQDSGSNPTEVSGHADMRSIPFMRDWHHHPFLTLQSEFVTMLLWFHALRHWGMAWIIKIDHFMAGAQKVTVAKPVVRGHTDQVVATPTNKFEAYLFILAGPASDLAIALALVIFGVPHHGFSNLTFLGSIRSMAMMILGSYFAILGSPIGSEEDWGFIRHGISETEFSTPLVANANLQGRVSPNQINRATVAAINQFMLNEAREHIPYSFWNDLPVGVDGVQSGMPHLTHAEGEVNQMFVEQFKKAWLIALQYHDGYVDPRTTDQYPLAEQQERDNGHIPYIVHLWTVTWNLMNEAGVTEPDAILTAPMHDFKEDVPKNVRRLISEFFLAVGVYFSGSGQFQLPPGLRRRFVNLMNRFPTLRDKIYEVTRQIADKPKPGTAEEVITEDEWQTVIQGEMNHRLQTDFPSAVRRQLETNIDVMTQKEGESNGAYAQRIRTEGSPQIVTLRLVDNASNITCRFPSHPYKYIRTGLLLVSDEKDMGSEPYKKGRRLFLNALIQRVRNSKENYCPALCGIQHQGWQAPGSGELLVVLDEFSAGATRHQDIAQDLPDWTYFLEV